jgi:fucose 4-O-acetylase-like acetyltransferase
MVVMIHVPIPSMVGSYAWFLSEILSYGICLISVPFFFVISGYFLGRSVPHGQTMNWWKRAMKKRIISLFVPYLIFNVLFWLFHHEWTGMVSISEFIFSILGNPFKYPVLGPMWYVRTLLLYVVISPLILKYINNSGGVIGAYLIGVVYYLLIGNDVGEKIPFSFFKYSFSLPNLFYFVFGVYASKHKVISLTRRHAYLFLGVAILILLGKTYLHFNGMSSSNIWRMVFCPMALIAFWKLCPDFRVSRFMMSLSFPIYLIHYFLLTYMLDLGFRVNSAYSFIFFYLFLLCLTIIVSLLLKKYLPASLLKVLFGGR